jgi:GR25 family glycosyltransferase involved in LPS biosynthesis
MKITNFFSEAYYINVDERTDRRKQIELELIKNKINNFVQRFDAITPNIKNPENLSDFLARSIFTN